MSKGSIKTQYFDDVAKLVKAVDCNSMNEGSNPSVVSLKLNKKFYLIFIKIFDIIIYVRNDK